MMMAEITHLPFLLKKCINWAEGIGIKERSVYNYINAYKFLQQLQKPEEKETFLAQLKHFNTLCQIRQQIIKK